MSITGNLVTMQLPELLQWLTQSNKSGILTTRHGKDSSQVFLNKGLIAYATCSLPNYSFDRVMVRKGKLSPDKRQLFLNRIHKEQKPPWRLAIDQGLLTEQEAHDLFKFYVEEILISLFMWDEGDFEFVEKNFSSADLLKIEITTYVLILEGVLARDEWAKVADTCPDPKTILEIADSFRQEGALDWREANDLAVLKLIDGKRSFEEIFLFSPLKETDTAKALAELFSDGILVSIGVREPEKPPEETQIEKLRKQVTLALEDANFFLALDLLNSILKLERKDAEALKWRKDIRKRLLSIMKTVFPSDKYIPQIVIPMDQLQSESNEYNLSDYDGYVLSRIDSRTNIANIIRIVGLKPDDVRLSLFKMERSGILNFKKPALW